METIFQALDVKAKLMVQRVRYVKRRRWRVVMRELRSLISSSTNVIKRRTNSDEKIRETNVVTSSDESDEVYMLLNSKTGKINLSMNSHIHECILDSCASFHVTSNKFWFDHLHESDHGHVVAWGGVAYRITGVGNVTVKFDSGFVHTLRKVRYVLHMGRNLISVGELESTGFMGRLGNGMIRMCKGALRAFKATRRNGIYITNAEVMSGLNSTISSFDTKHTQKWHNRLTHISVKGLKFLNDKGVFGKDQVRCMMFSSGVPKSFWDEAVMTACYLTNMTSSIVLNGDTLYEKWEESLVEVEKVSTHIPITLSEVESDTHQNQQNIDAEGNEDVIEENLVDPLADYQLARDKEKRLCREPQRLSDFSIAYASYQELVDEKPNTYVEAIKSEKSVEWFSTMKGEMSSFVRNQTWDLVPKPKDKSIVGCKWFYKVKEGTTESEPVRYKARLVAKGQWYRMFDSHVFYIGYKSNEFDNCLYYLHHSTNYECVYLLLYVDVILLDGPNMKVVNKISVGLSKEFDMKYLGHSRRFLGMKIDRDRSNSCIFVYQTPYVLENLKKFSIVNCKPTSVPLGNQFILSEE
ncbi:Uncharacterized protein Adt_18201 [Abeliophyllum distichum]|uniref:Polyprotein n=1 Tax=Abeliophyllum distichum TaxID=126358 RepID=A0ABD1TIQ5_9LAMI